MPIDFILNKITDLATREQLVDICTKLGDEYKRLEVEIEKLKNWEETKKDYEEVEFGDFDALLYQNKETKRLYCPDCFITKMNIIPLQPVSSAKKCTSCKEVYIIKKRKLGSI